MSCCLLATQCLALAVVDRGSCQRLGGCVKGHSGQHMSMLPRVILLCGLFLAVAMIFILRLAQLQLLQGAEFASETFEARYSVEVLSARRGRLIDRHGVVIADNRTIYNVAVVMQELSVDRRQRLRVPIYRFDSERLSHLASAIADELRLPLAVVRQQLEDELVLNPGVGVRRGAREETLNMGMLALPRMVMMQAEQDADPDVDPGYVALAESGLMLMDPREALEREYRQRQGVPVQALNPSQWQGLLNALSERYQTPMDHIHEILSPYAPQIRMEALAGDPRGWRWRLVAEDRRRQAEVSLARLLGDAPRRVREGMDEALLRLPPPALDSHWLYIPWADIGDLARHLPAEAPVVEVALHGEVPVRERLYLIQGEHPGQQGEGMFALLVERLRHSLGVAERRDSEWLAALIQHHGEHLTVRRSEREHRRHQLVLDAQALHRLSSRLANELADSRKSLGSLQIEQRITKARRLSDREWRGSTRFDPLVIVEDVESRVANRLAGKGGDVPWPQRRYFEETSPHLPGLQVITDIGREYPYPGHASHIIGYLGRLSAVYDHATALAMGLDPQGWLGRSGLESVYDELLQGSNGRRARLRTPQGHRLLEEVLPNPGVDIHLTLDMELQRVAESACMRWHELAVEMGLNTPRMDAARKRVNHGRAAIVVVDVNDGAIRAMASTPTYNLYDVRTRYRDLANPQQNPGQPLIDHATSASHPAGSTVKPLVAMIALAEGHTRYDEVFFSRGYMARSPQGAPILREFQPFTPREFTLPDSLTRSSNVVSATLAERVGPSVLTEWMYRFGMGRRNAVDVAWQRPGLLPRPENLAQLRPQEPTWYPSDTWRAGIGQFSAAAPVQLVSIPAAVANGGYIVEPYLWRDAPQRRTGEDRERLAISGRDLRAVQEGMIAVTRPGGTATALRLSGTAADVAVAAKTGTSEWGTRATRDHDRALQDSAMVWTPSHGWLIGYAPAENPEVAFAAFVYGGTSGGRACTGMVKEVLEAYFNEAHLRRE
ncbi:MAG: hypothetical protein EA401_02245 [Planctomycetota bacterium]|nr:MAG: hypothetical protein EA401_02245 [Planctomycetota bacterium]